MSARPRSSRSAPRQTAPRRAESQLARELVRTTSGPTGACNLRTVDSSGTAGQAQRAEPPQHRIESVLHALGRLTRGAAPVIEPHLDRHVASPSPRGRSRTTNRSWSRSLPLHDRAIGTIELRLDRRRSSDARRSRSSTTQLRIETARCPTPIVGHAANSVLRAALPSHNDSARSAHRPAKHDTFRIDHEPATCRESAQVDGKRRVTPPTTSSGPVRPRIPTGDPRFQ